jgi:hypothetical protein
MVSLAMEKPERQSNHDPPQAQRILPAGKHAASGDAL